MGAHSSYVSRWSQAQTADETSTHVGQDVAIQIRHHHDPVRVRCGVLGDLSIPQNNSVRSFGENNVDTDPKADAIEQVLVITDLRELFRDLAAGGQEHPIRHFPGADDETTRLSAEPNTHMMFALCTAVTRFLP